MVFDEPERPRAELDVGVIVIVRLQHGSIAEDEVRAYADAQIWLNHAMNLEQETEFRLRRKINRVRRNSALVNGLYAC